MFNRLRICTLIFTLILAIFCTGCSKNKEFEAESLTMLVTEETISQLESYTQLKTLDLSGSTCYDAILAYAAAHPQVDVRYTVKIGELTADNTQTEIQIGSSDEAESLIDSATYLPKLSRICLNYKHSSPELLDRMKEAFPKAELEYTLSLFGQELEMGIRELDISQAQAKDVQEILSVIRYLPELSYVKLGHNSEESGSLGFEELGMLQQARQDIVFDYGFTLFDLEFSTADEVMDLNHIRMDDRGAAVMEVLPYMTECTYLDMDSCNVSSEDMAVIREAFPDIKVVWRINFGIYSVRTDVERILASVKGEYLTGESVADLKYCTDVRYIDLGHNCINDISFVASMPELEVAVLAINYWKDASPLANCTKLEYLEIFNTNCDDISPLSGLTNLRHLNISWLENVDDLSPIYSLTNLERLWIGWKTPISDEQVEHYRQLNPDCEINTEDHPTEGGWRKGSRYELLVEQMGYEPEDYSFYYNDPKYYNRRG